MDMLYNTIVVFVGCILLLLLSSLSVRFLSYILRVSSGGSVEELNGETKYYRDRCEYKETLL